VSENERCPRGLGDIINFNNLILIINADTTDATTLTADETPGQTTTTVLSSEYYV